MLSLNKYIVWGGQEAPRMGASCPIAVTVFLHFMIYEFLKTIAKCKKKTFCFILYKQATNMNYLVTLGLALVAISYDHDYDTQKASGSVFSQSESPVNQTIVGYQLRP